MGKRRESLLNFNALVEGVFFVDLKLSQNPYMPTTKSLFKTINSEVYSYLRLYNLSRYHFHGDAQLEAFSLITGSFNSK